MNKLIEYLKDPALVARFQEIFGVKHKNRISTNNSSSKHEIKNSKSTENYVIENKFWFYLFLIGTDFGDERFFLFFIPFWFWNVDGAVGRRFVFVWTIVMYIGQGLKDIIKWPRPSYPVIRLQNKWVEEYGMPSTHAMVAVSIPFSIIFFTTNRYIYSVSLGIILCLFLSSIICLSRLYLGMHTVLDVIAGLTVAIIIMVVIIPVVDYLDDFFVFSSFSPVLLLILSFAAIYIFPQTDQRWTPTKNDTTMIIGVCVGIYIGSWANFKLGYMLPNSYISPQEIWWPSFYMLVLTVLRTILGFPLILFSKKLLDVIFKYLTSNEFISLRVKIIIIVEHLFCLKYFVTYFLVGFNLVCAIPVLFKCLGIERPAFYSEI